MKSMIYIFKEVDYEHEVDHWYLFKEIDFEYEFM